MARFKTKDDARGRAGKILVAANSETHRHAVSRYLDIAYVAVKPLSVVVLWLYYAILECGAHQATFGKRALAIKVTSLAGERVGFWRSFGRQAGKILSTALLGLGFVLAAFTRRKQALHDLLARCLVVRC